MASLLKQSTSVTIRMGPFVSPTDGVTEQTGLGSMGVEISKNHGAFGARNSATATAHDAEGWYSVVLDTTDTGTLGTLIVKMQDAVNHLPVWREFVVVAANVFDAWVGGTDVLQVDVSQWNNTNLATPDTAGYPKVTIKDGTGTGELDTASGVVIARDHTGAALATASVVAAAVALVQADTDDIQSRLPAALVGGRMDSSVGAMAAGVVTAAAVATDAIDADALAANAVAEIAAGIPTAAGVADAVWDEARSGHVTAGTFGEGVKTESLNTQAKADVNAEADTALVDVNLDHLVGTSASIPNLPSGTFLDQVRRKGAGSWNRETDSLEALREQADAIAGAGFGTSGSSLAALRAAISTLGAGATSQLVAGTSSYFVGGYLYQLTRLLRKLVEVPAINAKYTNDDLLTFLRMAWAQIWQDMGNVTDQPVLVRYVFDVVAGQEDYVLPPYVGRIEKLSDVDTPTGLPRADYTPRSLHNPYGFNWKVEGNILRVNPKPIQGVTLTLVYVPTGDVYPVEGRAQITDFDAQVDDVAGTTVAINDNVTGGSLDTRRNAYAGYYFRALSAEDEAGNTIASFDVQERVIRSYNLSSDRKITLRAPFSPAIDGNDGKAFIRYEIVPALWGNLIQAIYMQAALYLLATGVEREKYAMVEKETAKASRSAKLALSRQQVRTPTHGETDVPENRRFRRPF